MLGSGGSSDLFRAETDGVAGTDDVTGPGRCPALLPFSPSLGLNFRVASLPLRTPAM